MSSTGIRFAPPPLQLTPELRWVLLRAFGPEEAPVPRDLEATTALPCARKLGLAARIGARHTVEMLRAEVGEEAASGLFGATKRALARSMLLLELRDAVLDQARADGVPVVLLKFAALDALGVLTPGARDAVDLDLLLPESRMDELRGRLLLGGFSPCGSDASLHHPAPLIHPDLGVVELHRHLPGVRVPQAPRRFAAFESLQHGGWVHRHHDLEGRLVPTIPLLVAHLLAHGLAQHGMSPGAYSQFRMLGDLIDLGLGDDEGAGLVAFAGALIARDVSEGERTGIEGLCGLLRKGQLEPAELEGPPAVLLRHFLGGLLDTCYAASLKAHQLRNPLHEGGWLAGWVHLTRASLFLTDDQIDAIYGRPRGRMGYLGRRLNRPFDLARRLTRSVVMMASAHSRR